MGCKVLITSALAALLISATGFADAPSQQLQGGLTILNRLTGIDWEGRFQDADEPMVLFMKWEPIIDGAAVQMTGWSSASDMTRRNFYYWDRERKKVAFVAITSNGYVSTGTVVLEDSALVFVARQIDPDGTPREAMGRWTFQGDGSVLVIGYGKDGEEWKPGHRILYAPADPKP